SPARVHTGRDRRAAEPSARHGQLAVAARARPAARGSPMKQIDLSGITVPDESGAQARAWQIVERASRAHEPRPRRSGRSRRALVLALAAAALAVLIAVSVSPAGSSIVHSVREA